MKFFLSGEVDQDISERFRLALLEVTKALNDGICDLDVGSLTSWDFIAIIRAVDSPDYREVSRYHARDSSLEFRLKVDHGEFKRTDELGARRLLIAGVLRSVLEARALAPPTLDLDRIGQELVRVARANAWVVRDDAGLSN